MEERVRYKCQKCGREVLLPIFIEPLNCCGQKMTIISKDISFDKKIDKIKESKKENEIKRK